VGRAARNGGEIEVKGSVKQGQWRKDEVQEVRSEEQE